MLSDFRKSGVNLDKLSVMLLLGNYLLPLLRKLSENRLHLSNSSELDCIRFALSLRQIQ